MDFAPTHTLNLVDDRDGTVKSYDVQLDDEGRAYTREEWDACARADFEVVDGEWCFKGRPIHEAFPRRRLVVRHGHHGYASL